MVATGNVRYIRYNLEYSCEAEGGLTFALNQIPNFVIEDTIVNNNMSYFKDATRPFEIYYYNNNLEKVLLPASEYTLTFYNSSNNVVDIGSGTAVKFTLSVENNQDFCDRINSVKNTSHKIIFIDYYTKIENYDKANAYDNRTMPNSPGIDSRGGRGASYKEVSPYIYKTSSGLKQSESGTWLASYSVKITGNYYTSSQYKLHDYDDNNGKVVADSVKVDGESTGVTDSDDGFYIDLTPFTSTNTGNFLTEKQLNITYDVEYETPYTGETKTVKNTAELLQDGDVVSTGDYNLTINATSILSKTSKSNVAEGQRKTISYTVDINPKAYNLDRNSVNVTLIDKATKVYDIRGIKVTDLTDPDNELDITESCSVEMSEDGFKITVPDSRHLSLTYSLVVDEAALTDDDKLVSNDIMLEGIDSTKSGGDTDFEVARTKASGEGAANTFTVRKVDSVSREALKGVVFGLYKYENGDFVKVSEKTTDDDGLITFDSYDFGDYQSGEHFGQKIMNNMIHYIVEEEALPDYLPDTDKKYFILKGDEDNYELISAIAESLGIEDVHNENEIEIENIEKIDISGTKIWEDGDNQDGLRPGEIKINLLADGEIVDNKTLTKDDWSFTFTDLPKYKGDKEIVYTVDEEDVAGYEKQISGYTITNSHTPELTQIKITKSWDDDNNRDGGRPDKVIINILGNGRKVKEVELSGDNNWEANVTGLPKFENGKEIKYEISETDVTGYEAVIDGFDVTNSHKPEEISVKGTKTWNDNNNQDGIRPESITVKLLANGKEISKKKVSKETDWTYEFTGLKKYEGGTEIKYEVSEEAVPDYTPEIKGYDITNSYKPGVTSVTVSKVWDDGNDKDKIRPKEVKVVLLADGKAVKEGVITAEKLSVTFTDLPLMENGKEITYEVSEKDVANGYESAITGDAVKGFTITNTHTPKENPEVTISKIDATTCEELPGAKLVITKKGSKKVIAEHISTKEPWKIRLAPGEYTLTEITAPDGYEVAEAIDFTVNEKGLVGSERVEMADKPKPTETGTSEEPTTDTPEEPTTDTPEEPTTDTPEEPTTDTPEEPTTDEPEEPTTDTPEEPTTDEPEEPTTETPEEPTTDEPEEPTTETPEEPTTDSSEEPSTDTSEEPTTETLEDLSTETENKPTKTPAPGKNGTDAPKTGDGYDLYTWIVIAASAAAVAITATFAGRNRKVRRRR